MKITFYGASDDVIEVEGCEGADEFNSYERNSMWHGDLVTADAAIRIHVFYDGCWHVSVGQADEAIPLPDWPIKISQHRSLPYSALLEIDAPDSTRLTNVWPERGDDDG